MKRLGYGAALLAVVAFCLGPFLWQALTSW